MDILHAKIEDLAKLPGLAPETVTLIQMAAEAQRTGKMPEIPRATVPDRPKHCPHADPFAYCPDCVANPCPMGLGHNKALPAAAES